MNWGRIRRDVWMALAGTAGACSAHGDLSTTILALSAACVLIVIDTLLEKESHRGEG